MSDEEDKDPVVPKQWLNLDLNELVEKGWRPRIKKKGNKNYLNLRFGNQERSLGPATEETLDLFQKMFPDIHAMLTKHLQGTDDTSRVQGPKILATKIAKPACLGSTVHFSLRTLQWFEYFQRDLGYPGDLGQWLDNLVGEYFDKYQNIELAIVMGKN